MTKHKTVKEKAANKRKAKALLNASLSSTSRMSTQASTLSSKTLTEGNASTKRGRESMGENSPSKGLMKQGSNGNNCMEEEDTIMASNEDPTVKMAPRALTYNEDSTMEKNSTEPVNTSTEAMIDPTSMEASLRTANSNSKLSPSKEDALKESTQKNGGTMMYVKAASVNASKQKETPSGEAGNKSLFEIPNSIQAGVQIVDAFPFEPKHLVAIQDEVLPTKPNKRRTYDVACYQMDPKSSDTARTPYKGHFGEGKDYAHDDINRILCFMAPIVKGEPVDGGLALKPEYAPTMKQAIKIVGATLLNQLPEEFLMNHRISIQDRKSTMSRLPSNA
jgi:hypothetical protein